MRVAVIGCGIFGALAALRLAEAGHGVVIIDKNAGPLEGASYNNQNRLHLGYHYPRDEETAWQCIRGFQRFRDEFAGCLLDMNVNAYFVAAAGSLTSPADYLAFADRLGMVSVGQKPPRIDPGTFAPRLRGLAVGIAVPEVVYDCAELREIIRRRLAGTLRIFKAEVAAVERKGNGFSVRFECGGSPVDVDAVVNCTYADTNRLGAPLGHLCAEYQYEYTAVPIIEWRQAPVGITVMDGAFFTVLPFGKSGKFLLYHVEHSILGRWQSTQMPTSWRDLDTAPGIPGDFYEHLRAACAAFVPALDAARMVGLLRGPRVVLAHRDKTDSRPSLVSAPEPRYVTVFSGKIDHCMWAAREVVARLAEAA